MVELKLRCGPLDGQTVRYSGGIDGELMEFRGELKVLGKKIPVTIQYYYDKRDGKATPQGMFHRISPVLEGF